MIFKSKAKKAENEAIERADNSSSYINQIVDEYQEFEIHNVNEIGREVDFNYPRMYIYMMCNYAQDIALLYETKRYSSLYTLYYDFIKCYGICSLMLELYFTERKRDYDQLIKSLFVLSLAQRKNECENYSDEYLNSHREEVEFFKLRYDQMEGILREYFADRACSLNDDINPKLMYEIIEELEDEFNLQNSIDEIAINAISNNENLTKDEKREAIKIFISGKSAKENNIQTVITRILGNIQGQRALILNKKESVVPKILVFVEKLLSETIEAVKIGFEP